MQVPDYSFFSAQQLRQFARPLKDFLQAQQVVQLFHILTDQQQRRLGDARHWEMPIGVCRGHVLGRAGTAFFTSDAAACRSARLLPDVEALRSRVWSRVPEADQSQLRRQQDASGRHGRRMVCPRGEEPVLSGHPPNGAGLELARLDSCRLSRATEKLRPSLGAQVDRRVTVAEFEEGVTGRARTEPEHDQPEQAENHLRAAGDEPFAFG